MSRPCTRAWRTRLISRTGCLRRSPLAGRGANAMGTCRKGRQIPPRRFRDSARKEGRERFLSSDELARLGDALAQCETRFGPYASGAIRLLCLTGARLNEVLALRWQEVDFERGLALLPDSKTGRKIVQLSAPALAVLANLPRLSGCPYVIAGMDGRRADLQRPWAFVKEAAGSKVSDCTICVTASRALAPGHRLAFR
jgi:integrase